MSQSRFCEQCGAAWPQASRFCEACGQPVLAEAQAVPPVVPTTVLPLPCRPTPRPRHPQAGADGATFPIPGDQIAGSWRR